MEKKIQEVLYSINPSIVANNVREVENILKEYDDNVHDLIDAAVTDYKESLIDEDRIKRTTILVTVKGKSFRKVFCDQCGSTIGWVAVDNVNDHKGNTNVCINCIDRNGELVIKEESWNL